MRSINRWVVVASVSLGAVTSLTAFAASIDGVDPQRRSAAETLGGVVADTAQTQDRALALVEQARAEAERRNAHRVWEEGIRAKVSRFGLTWPRVDMITSHYGQRRRGFHHGMDILCSRTGGEPIYAAAAGVVTAARVMPVYGRAAIISHPDGTRTLYAHMWSVRVHAGDRVQRGQQIGTCGSTGNSTAPHLHFEYYRHGRPVNPLPHLAPWT